MRVAQWGRDGLAAVLLLVAAVGGCYGPGSGAGSGNGNGDGDGGGNGNPDLPDGGETPDSGNPYDTPVQCTSNSVWSGGDRGSASMHPGRACISCHTTNHGPSFVLAGTVYPSAHEPIDCNGASGVTVVITDANGQTHSFKTNGAGNFYAEGVDIPLPYQAKVVADGRERAMGASQTEGDCNSCHTQSGDNGAPGRILAP